jgi:hypothetical protein
MAQTISCNQRTGEPDFFRNRSILVERHGVAVKIRPAQGATKSAEDYWTYRIVFEEKGVGIRAIRASRPQGGSAGLDVEFGGELFLLNDKAVPRLLVTGVNAVSGKVSSAEFSC